MPGTSPHSCRRIAALAVVAAVLSAGAVPAYAATQRNGDYDAKPPQAGQPFYTEQQLATNGKTASPTTASPR